MRSCVFLLAPFQEILTSDATGTMRSAHAAAPFFGNVPLVVRFSFTPYSAHRSMISSKWRYTSGSPMVEGMISRSPVPGDAAITLRSSAMSMRLLGRPAVRRSACVAL